MVEIFPVLLILASQRIEDIMGWDLPSDTTKRGSLPSVVEYCILAYVAGRGLQPTMVSASCGLLLFRAITANLTSSFDVVIQETLLCIRSGSEPHRQAEWYPVSDDNNKEQQS